MADDVISSMYHQLEFLSPHYDDDIEFDGIKYPTLRQALEATKTISEAERMHLASHSAFGAAQWGIHRPYLSNPWHEEWQARVDSFTLALVAQKFGLIRTAPDYKSKMKNALYLLCTGSSTLIYTSALCDTLWGICLCREHLVTEITSWEYGTGQNRVGEAMEAARARLAKQIDFDPLHDECDWCLTKKKGAKHTPGSDIVLYYQDGIFVKRVSCSRHRGATIQEARHHADFHEWFVYPISILPSGIKHPESFLIHPQKSAVPTATTTAIAVRHTSNIRASHWNGTYRSSPPEKSVWGAMIMEPGKPDQLYLFRGLERD